MFFFHVSDFISDDKPLNKDSASLSCDYIMMHDAERCSSQRMIIHWLNDASFKLNNQREIWTITRN